MVEKDVTDRFARRQWRIRQISLLFRHESRSMLVNFIFYSAELAFVIVLTSVVGQAVFGHGRLTFHRIQGAIAFYLLIAVIFAYFSQRRYLLES